jgi:hypothetical protein
MRSLYILALSLILPNPALAQMFIPPFNFTPQIAARIVQPQLDFQRKRAGLINGQQRQQLSPAAPLARRPVATLTFVPVMSARKANLAGFVEKTRKDDPAGAAKMERLLASTDVIGAIGRGIAPYGLRVDNVADAFTVWWTAAWRAAHGDTSDADQRTTRAVQAQAVNAILTAPEMANATPAQKQQYAEALLVQAALIEASVETYKSDPKMMRQIGNAVRQGAIKSGLDLDAMTLTDQGFVPSGKTGAADPAPGAPEQALAANDAPAPAAVNPPYVLMAAAGGAGIGGVFLIGKMLGRRG